jgi:hypothetical protein
MTNDKIQMTNKGTKFQIQNGFEIGALNLHLSFEFCHLSLSSS